MQDIRLENPLHGQLAELKEVRDPAFAGGTMGIGAAVKDPSGQVYSPVDGEITVFFETKHAIGIHSVEGADILIHVGLDTVKLNGQYFTAKAAQGDKVSKGQLLLTFDAEAIKAAGYDTTTPVVVTNPSEFGQVTVVVDGQDVTVSAAADRMAAAPVDESEYADLPQAARVAKLIEKYVGGMDNVRSAEHCATRLRLIINDKSRLDDKAIENIDGVKGQFFAAAQYQIILGTGFVDKVFAEFVKGVTFNSTSNKDAVYAQMTPIQKISRTLGDVFVPIIPVLVATGLFMGLRGMCQSLGVQFSDNVLKMSQILTDTAFAFLPALVAWSTMKKFGGNPVIGIVLGLMLVSPSLPNAYSVASGTAEAIQLNLFGLVIPIVGYQGSVLPALAVSIIAANLEKRTPNFRGK